ncbi:uncharacterized protein LOC103706854 [Phoenix dactylifera]|uniref:Uncharacterized protein LOC103706854 n=1 Tax=Phoenix dactylifera TaxID=42345 RepID=A0A8B9A467_PHODC|nr:uncharacterized protein LOC103706854 [Phoenix dactylifera]
MESGCYRGQKYKARGGTAQNLERRKMSASPLLLRSRVSARTISLALRPSKKSIQSEVSPLIPSSRSPISPSERRISVVFRLRKDSSCLVSMLPLHSAIASARLRSVLSPVSQHWGWVPQGTSMPL